MTTKYVKGYGEAGMSEAVKYVRGGQNRVAYWRQAKGEICSAENVCGRVTWRKASGDEIGPRGKPVRLAWAAK